MTDETYLEQLLPSGTIDDFYCGGDWMCGVCAKYGACREYVLGMAEDANVPEEWLAEMFIKETVNTDWSIDDIQDEYRRQGSP